MALTALQGLLVTAGGAGLVAVGSDPDLLEEGAEELAADLAVEPEHLTAIGIALIVVGVVHLALALGLALRRPLARSVLGVLATLQVATNVFALVAVRDIRGGTVWALALSVAVLWLLYGSEATREQFAS